MIIGICASSPRAHFSLPNVDYVIGVDRGTKTLLHEGFVPNEMIGDFDSITEEEFAQLEKMVPIVHKYDAQKNDTDTDLALKRAVELNPEIVYLTCVTGGRLDHQEAVLRSVLQFQLTYRNIRFIMLNKQNEIEYLREGNHLLKKGRFQYVSFYAVTEDIHGVTLSGVKYETNDEPMNLFSTRFTSNEIIKEDASISISNGICLMIKSND